MTTLGDYSSLFEVGLAVGLTLALFRAPIDLRMRSIRHQAEQEATLIKGGRTPVAKAKWRLLLAVRLRFAKATRDAEQEARWPILGVLAGAAANLVSLIVACVAAGDEAGLRFKVYAVSISVLYYIVILGWMEMIGRRELQGLRETLGRIRRADTLDKVEAIQV